MRLGVLPLTSALAFLAALPGCKAEPRCEDAGMEADGCDAAIPAPCGNGVLDDGEACDDGAANSDEAPDACRLDCTTPSCGDGVIDAGGDESCDPPGAFCTSTCVSTIGCGDGVLAADEGCDDGNNTDGDGCDDLCRPERYECPDPVVALACGVPVMGVIGTGGDARTYCAGTFDGENTGEQVFELEAPLGEEVAFHLDGLTGNLDLFVANDCDPDACVAAGAEAGTSAEVAVTIVEAGRSYHVFVDGYQGGAGPFTLRAGCASTAVCGDGLVDGGEDCDDGDTAAGDGCSTACRLEVGGGLCEGDAPPGPTVLAMGVPAVVALGDVGGATHAANVSCNAVAIGCSGAGPEIVAEIVMPAGATDLTVAWDHTGGDELYAVTAGDAAVCVELECLDPYPYETGTHTFEGVATGAAAATVFVVADACDAMGASGVATTVTLTAQ